jgi:hypothetical protein
MPDGASRVATPAVKRPWAAAAAIAGDLGAGAVSG